MEHQKDTYYCKTGDMALSRNVYKILVERFPNIQKQPNNTKIGSGITKMYCPGCGEMLDKELKCQRCNGSIADLSYQLIEFHPHLKEDDTWGI